MSEPRTEAGRRFLTQLLDPSADEFMHAGIARAAILAIEAEAALSSTEAGRLREVLTQILLPAAWRPLADRPGAWITVLSTEHLARLRAALEGEAER